MSECTDVQFIYNDEFIGNSLSKINTNFQLLTGAACELQQILDARVNIRTFFYYGPNSPNSATEFDREELKPSNSTIQRFINNEINLPAISEDGDYAWVVYQRTGWRNLIQEFQRNSNGTIPFTRIETFTEPQIITVQEPVYYKISIGKKGKLKGYKDVQQTIFVPVDRPVTYYAPFAWSVSLADQYRAYSPIFVIYKLRFDANTNTYTVLTNEGFPKYSRGVTANTNNWNRPDLWDIY